MKTNRFWLVASIALVMSLISADAADARFVENFRDWNLYVHEDGAAKTCYIASVPTRQDGNFRRRGPAAVLVARLPTTPPNEQVSVQPGYPYLENSEVDLAIAGRTWKLFTQGEHAWAREAAEDDAIIAAMKAGSTMTVRGTSQLRTYSLDTYSLLGFTAAYNAMVGACS
jgi:hypothetical protein